MTPFTSVEIGEIVSNILESDSELPTLSPDDLEELIRSTVIAHPTLNEVVEDAMAEVHERLSELYDNMENE